APSTTRTPLLGRRGRDHTRILAGDKAGGRARPRILAEQPTCYVASGCTRGFSMTTPSADSAPRRNRLARSSSPYLRQHDANPVDWYEWGLEALERARREQKPILLSVGYSA